MSPFIAIAARATSAVAAASVLWKRAEIGGGSSGQEIVDGRFHHRPRIDFQRRGSFVNHDRIEAALGVVGDHVPAERDFAFVSRVADAKDHGADGVEVAADAARGRGVEAARDHAANGFDRGGGEFAEERHGVQRRNAVEGVVEQRQGGAPRLPDGLIAAGQRNRTEGGEALELLVIGNQNLAAPRGAVGAEAGAVSVVEQEEVVCA